MTSEGAQSRSGFFQRSPGKREKSLSDDFFVFEISRQLERLIEVVGRVEAHVKCRRAKTLGRRAPLRSAI
jgi:hypothetical protein